MTTVQKTGIGDDLELEDRCKEGNVGLGGSGESGDNDRGLGTRRAWNESAEGNSEQGGNPGGRLEVGNGD